jgi:hypothetical protein
VVVDAAVDEVVGPYLAVLAVDEAVVGVVTVTVVADSVEEMVVVEATVALVTDDLTLAGDAELGLNTARGVVRGGDLANRPTFTEL